jgi:hypothetical protein
MPQTARGGASCSSASAHSSLVESCFALTRLTVFCGCSSPGHLCRFTKPREDPSAAYQQGGATLDRHSRRVWVVLRSHAGEAGHSCRAALHSGPLAGAAAVVQPPLLPGRRRRHHPAAVAPAATLLLPRRPLCFPLPSLHCVLTRCPPNRACRSGWALPSPLWCGRSCGFTPPGAGGATPAAALLPCPVPLWAFAPVLLLGLCHCPAHAPCAFGGWHAMDDQSLLRETFDASWPGSPALSPLRLPACRWFCTRVLPLVPQVLGLYHLRQRLLHGRARRVSPPFLIMLCCRKPAAAAAATCSQARAATDDTIGLSVTHFTHRA